MKKYFFSVIFILICACSETKVVVTDPLPSWNEGPIKQRVLQFVRDITLKGGIKYVSPEDRIATFDNDGTLWSEVPLVEVEFTKERLRSLLKKNPSLASRRPYKGLETKGKGALPDLTPKDIMEIMAVTHGGMSEEQFAEDVKSFFKNSISPRFNVAYQKLTYQPMVELVRYLQSQDFKVFICSGGDTSFMRVVASEIYGIPPENIIGSFFNDKTIEKNGKLSILRTSKLGLLNDKAGKPVGILRHIGRRPIFAAGNVRSGGDIEHLRYSSEGRLPSLQLMVNHDDAERESAYAEKDGASLKAAKNFNWQVVSMKNDWKRIFSEEISGPGPNRISKRDSVNP